MNAPLLKLDGINKSFGPVDVLHDISLEVKAGEVLCLLGDNGAGKSTLIRILSGVHQPSSGEMLMDGEAALQLGYVGLAQFVPLFALVLVAACVFLLGVLGRAMAHLAAEVPCWPASGA